MWDFLFADNAAIVAHSAEDLQQLMNRFSKDCQDFGLTISRKKTQVMGQGVDSPPSITISTQELEVVHDFVYLGSTISDTLSLDVELDKRIGKAATMFSRLTKRVWFNKKLMTYCIPVMVKLFGYKKPNYFFQSANTVIKSEY